MSSRSGATEGEFWGDADADEALNRYRTLVDAIDDGIFQLDVDGRFVALNDVIAETTGCSRDELLGEHVSRLLEEDDAERVERAIARQVESDGGTEALELAVRTAEGGAVPCELRVNPLVEAGDFRGAIGVVRERPEAEGRPETPEGKRALDDSVTALFDEANVGVFVLDDEFDVALADETVGEYFGIDRDDLVGVDKREVVTETITNRVEDPDRFAERVLATYDDNSYVEEFECHVTAGEGREERWLEHRSKPIESGHYAGGRIELYYDVTERKRSADALLATEEQFYSLVDTVEEYAIFRLDPDGHVISWNEGAKAIKGYESEEIVGEHFSTFYTEDDRAAGVPERNLARASETGSVEDEGWRVRKDGSKFWGSVTITEVRDDDGSHRGYLKVTRDMTDRHRREQEIRSELRRILGRISDAFYAVDEDFRFTHVNERAEELLQHPEEELIGKRIWDAFPEAADTVFWDRFHEAMDSQEPVSFETKDDALDVWIEVNAYPSETGLSVYFQDVTERKRAQQQLEEERDMFAEGPAIVFRWKPRGEGWPVEYVSENVEDVLGYTPTELESGEVPYKDLLLDEEVGRITREVMENSDGTTERFNHEPYRVKTKDGDVRWVKDITKIVRDETGDVTNYLGYLVDITERKERERELDESRRLYRTLVEHFRNGAVALVDEDLRYQVAGGTPVDVEAETADDLEGRPIREAISTELADILEPRFRAALDGESSTFEEEHGGNLSRFHVFPVRDKDDEVFAAMGMSQDVTQLKEREAELERTLDLLERTERIADVGGWEIDVDTMDVYWTDHIFDLLEESSDEEPPLEEALDMYHEEDRPIVEGAVEEALDSGEPFDVEARIWTVGGEVRWLRLQGVPETDDGDVVSLRGAAQDVTERRKRERRLEGLVEQLGESNERLEQFAYAASHDLQEPLRMVSSYLQLIERRYGDELDDDGREFLEFAVDGADRMREMIDGLLEYSRVETRGDPFEPVDLDAVFADIRRDLQVSIEESDAEITAEPLPRVEGDAGQLRQVFQNLLHNAIEYSGDEPPRVHVSAERRGAGGVSERSTTGTYGGGGEWIVSVRDEGIGVDPDDQERIFEVFQSVQGLDEHAGTGIGLALCERIIERHGGDIWVESEPGEGATFSFTLPRAGEHDE